MSEAASPAGSGVSFSGARLDSWKAIAGYLGRHVTTVQRWEEEEGLPVHRHQHKRRGSVYAYTAELEAWLAARTSEATPGSIDFPESASTSGNVAAETVRPTRSRHAEPAGHAELSVAAFAQVIEDGHAGAARARSRWKSSFVWTLGAAMLGTTIVGAIAGLWRPGSRGESTTSLAVLPLQNRSPDGHSDYFVDGMTEALTTDLASLSAIRVIARQSAAHYRNSAKPASEIASELKADALVEGGVQRSGQRVRVDIRLIDGRTSRSLWAGRYERDLGDELALQAELSRAIVRELHLKLEPSQVARLGNRRPANPEAWDAYLRARFFWNKRTHEDMSRAIQWYERAIEHDSASPLIYAGLADVYATLGPPNTPISELIARGTIAAEKAIQLDPEMGEPLAALGKLSAYAWDWQGAERNYRRAIELAPGYAPARYWFGSFLANHDRCDEALAQAREAERLDPISLPGNMVISGIELRCDRVDQAIKRSLTVLEFDPNYSASYEFLGRAYLAQGNVQQAIPMLERAVTLNGGMATVRATLAYAYAAAGRRHEAIATAKDLSDRHARGKTLASAWSVAIARAGLHRDEDALAWLEHSYADHEEWLEGLAVDDRFRRLHGHPRFQRLLVQLRLPAEQGPTTRR
ncbi:MAG: tetratricopeptide repeat protein [Acidobacteria bacterium]|nr:tetratricopeptide repeat protein [Acidobacteriota bacterium]